MCLNRVTKQYEPVDQEVVVWKVFEQWRHEGGAWEDGYLEFCHGYTEEGSMRVPTNRWVKANYKPGVGVPDYNGKVGFHAFLSQEDAEKYREKTYKEYRGNNTYMWRPVVHQVKVKGVHTEGLQDNLPVVVANWMFCPGLKGTGEQGENNGKV